MGVEETSGSPFVLATRLKTYVGHLLATFDVDSLDQAQRREFKLMKRLLADARLDTRDYELSETRVEQVGKAVQARNRLEELRLHILRASEHNVFSAIDVAQISAQLDEIIAKLE